MERRSKGASGASGRYDPGAFRDTMSASQERPAEADAVGGRSKIGIIVAGSVAVLAVLLLIGKNLIAKTALTAGVRAMTGLELTVGRMAVGLLSTSIDMRNVRIVNPPGFQERTLVSLPRVYVDYDLGAFLGGRVHLEALTIAVDQINVVRGTEEQVNVMALKPIREPQGGPAPPGPAAGKAPPLQIDVLELEIGTHITDAQALVQLIIIRALGPTNVAKMIGLNVGQLAERVSQTMQGATGIPLDHVTSSLFSNPQVQAGVQGMQDTVEQTAETLKKFLPTSQ
jgi:uncharacterized protein involved in outer membrane biogenesis